MIARNTLYPRRSARMGHNPRTGQPVSVPEKPTPFFKAGKQLRGRLNRDGIKRHRAGLLIIPLHTSETTDRRSRRSRSSS